MTTSAFMTDQRREIEAARKLLKPHPVELGVKPRWLKTRLKPYRDKHSPLNAVPDLLLRAANKVVSFIERPHWLDHWGTSVTTCRPNKPCFVSEPYGFDERTAKILSEIEKMTGLKWRVESNAWWYPGHTVRIEIFE